MITPRDIVLGGLLPAAVTALVLIAAALLPARTSRLRHGLVPLAVSAGFAAGFAALLGVPRLQPLDSVDWLFYAAIGAGALAALDRATSSAAVLRFIVVLGLSGVFVWLLARPLLMFHWTGRAGPMWIGAIALLSTVFWLSLDRLGAAAPGKSLTLALGLVAALSAVAIMLSGSVKLGQLAGVLAAAVLAVVLMGFALREAPTSRGVALVYALVHTALIACAGRHMFANLTTLNAALLLISPHLAWLAEAPILAGRPRMRIAARVVLATIPAACAVALARAEFARESSDPSEYSY